MYNANIRTRRLRLFLLCLLTMVVFFAGSTSAAALKVKLKTNAKITVTKGETIKLTATAKGGTGKYKYRFRYQKDGGGKVLIRKFKSSASTTFKPEKAGMYTIYVAVSDGKNQKAASIRICVKNKMSAKEQTARKKIVSTAMEWLKVREGSGEHQRILSYYNSVSNNFYRTSNYSFSGQFRYSHYNISLSESWCDAFVSAVFIKAKMHKISGVECGCPWHILWLQHNDSFVETDDYVPDPGDIIFYCWSDSGAGDCRGVSGHVGIVKSVSDTGDMVIIEGNYNDQVKYRKIKVNAQYIRGYGVPKYKNL